MRDVKPIIGYVHTGIEKSCEDQQYWKVIPFVERMDYLSYYFNAMAFCMAVERLLDEEVPERAQWLRVIHLELNRVASHLFCGRYRIARHRRDHHAVVGLPRPRPRARPVRDVRRASASTTRYFQVGGVVEDIPPGFEERTRKFVETMRMRIPAVPEPAGPQRDLAPAHEGHGDRAGGGHCSPSASPARCCAPRACRGTSARPCRTRSYERFDFKVPVGAVGDNYDRFRVRIEEMSESLRIIEQALDGLPEGPTSRRTARSLCHRGTSSPPRWRRSSTTSSS